jgi:hypothetical protein
LLNTVHPIHSVRVVQEKLTSWSDDLVLTYRIRAHFIISCCSEHTTIHSLRRAALRQRLGKLAGRGGKLAPLATSLDLSKLALLILHNRWHECIQPLINQISTNHRLVLIYMNLAHNVFIGIRHNFDPCSSPTYCGRKVVSGVLGS